MKNPQCDAAEDDAVLEGLRIRQGVRPVPERCAWSRGLVGTRSIALKGIGSIRLSVRMQTPMSKGSAPKPSRKMRFSEFYVVAIGNLAK